jgi:hypothetical protein
VLDRGLPPPSKSPQRAQNRAPSTTSPAMWQIAHIRFRLPLPFWKNRAAAGRIWRGEPIPGGTIGWDAVARAFAPEPNFVLTSETEPARIAGLKLEAYAAAPGKTAPKKN